METKKPGRPKGNKKPYCMRLEPSLKERIDSYLDAEIDRRHQGDLKSIEDWLFKTYGIIGRRETEVVPKLTPTQARGLMEFELSDRKEIDFLKKRIKELEDKIKVHEGYST
jgi:hypothetical protein